MRKGKSVRKDSSMVVGKNTILVRIPYNGTLKSLKTNLEPVSENGKPTAAEMLLNGIQNGDGSDEILEHIFQATVVLRAANEAITFQQAVQTAIVMWFG